MATLCARMLDRIASLDDAQDLIEYALLVALVALVALATVTQIGQTMRDVFWAVISAAIP